jgi:hypothetical protein
MRYMLLLYGDQSMDADMTPEQLEAIMPEWRAFGERYAAIIRGGEALQPTTTATSVRAPGGDAVLTDGPFAETREQLGGYYLLECDSLDQAIEAAGACPAAAYGTVEIRPIMELPEA